MPAPTTVGDFLEVVRRSDLILPERLQAFLANEEEGATPRQLAARMVLTGLVTQFQAEQFLLGKWRGFTIGKYKVLERIGYGGNGTVYLCEHMVVRRRVAVKVLPTNKADSPTALTRFYREARAAGALDHPHLVKAHDIDQDNNFHFLVMDYVDGTNLQDFVSRCGPLDPVRAANYIAQATLGLQAAHDAGLVHRDVKPGNILLDRHGVIRLSDLGLARFFSDGDDPLTLRFDDKCILGTADYVAPEQAINSHEVDGRADVYSLGATFYFLLAGQPMFPEGKAAQKLIAHQVREPVAVREVRPEVPEAMAEIVAKMVAKRPGDRYQTPTEVLAALSPWTQLPIDPPTEEEMPQLSPAARGPMSEGPSAPGSILPRVAKPPAARGATRTMVDLQWESSTSGLGVPQAGPRQAVAQLKAKPAPAPAAASPSRHTLADAATRPDATPSVPQLASEPVIASLAANGPAPAVSPSAVLRRRRDRQALRLAIILTVGIGIGGILKWRTNAPNALAPPPPTRIVARDAPGAFPTITAALQQAPAGTHILVRAAAWEEALRVPAEVAADISIEGQSPDGARTHWRPPHGHPEGQPLLRVTGPTGLRLSGMVLDGEDRLHALVVLAGPCPNLLLEDLQLEGFRQTAIRLQRCDGTADQPVVVRRARLVPGRGATAAITFAARPDEANRHVRITDCRLEGPYQAAIVLDGPTEDVVLEHNRTVNARDGILYRKASPAHPVGITLAGNTFCEIEQTGLHFETLPPVERSRVAITNNLFARTPVLAHVDDFSPQPAHTAARWIWARTKSDLSGPLHLRKELAIDGPSVVHANLNIACDPSFVVWINGERVGHGDLQSFTQVGTVQFRASHRRVYSFPVGTHLRPGKNVVAVEAGAGSGPGGMLAQLTYTCPGTAPITLVSDASWRVGQTATENWRGSGFDDSGWSPAQVVADYGKGAAGWQGLVWDSVVEDHFQGKVASLFPDLTGNACDWNCLEGFPALGALASLFELPTDARDDGRFLHYPPTSPLTLVGSPGAPPVGPRP
jgi:serine/threonine protein kinase